MTNYRFARKHTQSSFERWLYIFRTRVSCKPSVWLGPPKPDFLYLYARILLLEHYARFHEDYNSELMEDIASLRKSPNSSSQLRQIRFQLASLTSMAREIAKICQMLPQSQIRSDFENLLKDISSLKLGYGKSVTDYKESKQDALLNEQLKEAK